MPIVVIGLSHHSAPVEVRERFAIAQDRVPEFLEALKGRAHVQEAVLLSTCNRVELYVASQGSDRDALSDLHQSLNEFQNCTGSFEEHFYQMGEPESVHHLFRVASGMDSMVLGETEILGQLKQAYELARKNQHTGARLNKAFQRAFNVAKHIRTHTNIQRGSISVAAVAVQLAERIFEKLSGQRVLVIGAGDTSEKTLRALVSRGARDIILTNRTLEKAQALAEEFNGRAAPFETWTDELAHSDILITSTSATEPILTRAKLAPVMKARRSRPLLLIDIAVPRDIAQDVAGMDDVYLYNVDDLQHIADDYLEQRKGELARCEDILRAKAADLLDARIPPGAGQAQRSPALGA